MFFLCFLLLCHYHTTSIASNPFLDETQLTDSKKIQNLLFEQGFKKYFFKSEDHIKLCGLLLDQSKEKNIQATILYCAGFYPGTKEGMSSFYALLADQPYNFFMFDARGHQESDGSLFSYQAIKNYGTYEYQDIIGALKFLNQYNKQHNITQNIIIHGICSGAFHSIKACSCLKNTDFDTIKNVKGIIFDSGWLEVVDIVEPTICAEISKRFANGWFSWIVKPLCFIGLYTYRWLFKQYHTTIAGINSTIHDITCPIFFIHCTHDPYVPIRPVQKKVIHDQFPYFWWIEHDSHANFHVIEPSIYAEKIKTFLTKDIRPSII